MLLERAGELTIVVVYLGSPRRVTEVLLLMVVLEGKMLPGLFAAIFQEFVRRFFAEGGVGKKSSCSWDFQCFVFVAYCFRYYYALSLLLLVHFFAQEN